MGYPKLREEWVINPLCDGSDAQDWGGSGGVNVLQACVLNADPNSFLVSSAQSAQSKWDIPVTDT